MSLLSLVLSASGASPAAAAGPFERGQRASPRVKVAFESHEEGMRQAFEKAGAAWPPRGLFLRAFKHEGALELWAQPEKAEPRVLVRSFPICAASGVLGPKRRSGDFQVPEGFYEVDRFNPRSKYHLSLGLDYPNAVDRARAGGDPPGGDIFIHGDCVTIGCLPLENDPIEALYVVAVMARDRGQKHLPVHLFPCRFGTKECRTAMAGASRELTAFWSVLAVGFGEFEATRIPPRYEATAEGYLRKP